MAPANPAAPTWRGTARTYDDDFSFGDHVISKGGDPPVERHRLSDACRHDQARGSPTKNSCQHAATINGADRLLPPHRVDGDRIGMNGGTRRTTNRSGIRTPTLIDAFGHGLCGPNSARRPTDPIRKNSTLPEREMPRLPQCAIARQVTSSNCGSPCENSPTAAFTRAITSAAFAPALRARRSRRRSSPNWRASASAASVTPSV
jgi:hypothetical protein